MFLASKLFYLANIGMKPPDPHCYFELDSTSLFSPLKVVCLVTTTTLFPKCLDTYQY